MNLLLICIQLSVSRVWPSHGPGRCSGRLGAGTADYLFYFLSGSCTKIDFGATTVCKQEVGPARCAYVTWNAPKTVSRIATSPTLFGSQQRNGMDALLYIQIHGRRAQKSSRPWSTEHINHRAALIYLSLILGSSDIPPLYSRMLPANINISQPSADQLDL